jgi:hypothetical protein
MTPDTEKTMWPCPYCFVGRVPDASHAKGNYFCSRRHQDHFRATLIADGIDPDAIIALFLRAIGKAHRPISYDEVSRQLDRLDVSNDTRKAITLAAGLYRHANEVVSDFRSLPKVA